MKAREAENPHGYFWRYNKMGIHQGDGNAESALRDAIFGFLNFDD